eukprot:2929848-Pyramimonas_sp.AAC.1
MVDEFFFVSGGSMYNPILKSRAGVFRGYATKVPAAEDPKKHLCDMKSPPRLDRILAHTGLTLPWCARRHSTGAEGRCSRDASSSRAGWESRPLVGVDRMGGGVDRTGVVVDRMGLGADRMGLGGDRMGVGVDRMGVGVDRMGTGVDRMGA